MYASHHLYKNRPCVACIGHASHIKPKNKSVTRAANMRRIQPCMRRIFAPDSKTFVLNPYTTKRRTNSIPTHYHLIITSTFLQQFRFNL